MPAIRNLLMGVVVLALSLTPVVSSAQFTPGQILTAAQLNSQFALYAKTGNPLSQFAATTSAQLAGVISDETGTGSIVFSTSPTLVTPALGTPSAVTLTNGTGLPVTGLTGLGTGVATSLGVAVTGSGGSVLATSPSIATPTITGGSIDNATVGATTPSTGSFTTLGATSFNQSINLTGTPAANCTNTVPTTNYCANFLQLGPSTFDNANVGAGFVNAFAILHNYGGTAAQGGRQTFYVQSTLASPTSASNTNRNYVAGQFYAQAASGDGGTNSASSATSKGGIFALNPIAVAYSGATNLLELTGAEVNISAQTGSSMYYKAGLTIVQGPNDSVHGTVYDAGIALSNQGGSPNWNSGILFGPMNGQFPITATGCLICSSGAGTAATGIDFSSLTLTNFLIGPGSFSVNGTGQLFTSAVTSTGPVTGTSGTFSNSLSATFSNAAIFANDTSSTNNANYFWQKNGTNVWNLTNASSSGTLCLGRYVSGTLTDTPLCFSNSTGLATFSDGVSSTTGAFSGVVNPQAGLQGVTAGAAAGAGIVGQIITNTTSGTSLTTATTANGTSVSLTAGDWDVQCSTNFVAAAGAVATNLAVSVGTTSLTLGGLGQNTILGLTFGTAGSQWISSPLFQINVSTTTTAYCPIQATFSGGTMTANNFIRARRVR